jgi:hypothetical protein
MAWKKPWPWCGSWPEQEPPVPRKTLHFIGFSKTHFPGVLHFGDGFRAVISLMLTVI